MAPHPGRQASGMVLPLGVAARPHPPIRREGVWPPWQAQLFSAIWSRKHHCGIPHHPTASARQGQLPPSGRLVSWSSPVLTVTSSSSIASTVNDSCPSLVRPPTFSLIPAVWEGHERADSAAHIFQTRRCPRSQPYRPVRVRQQAPISKRISPTGLGSWANSAIERLTLQSK